MMTATLIFLGASIVTAVASAMGKCPVWVPMVMLCVVVALIVLPK